MYNNNMKKQTQAEFKNKRAKLSKKGKYFLKFFLAIIILTIILRLATSAIMDMGYYKGHIHPWYWKDAEINKNWPLYKAFLGDKTHTIKKLFETCQGEDMNVELFLRAPRHPYFFWTFTQFTWQTTFLLSIIVFFRIYKYDEKIPSWLKWTQKQTTLSIITMYDIIVAIGFWSALATSFKNAFSHDRELFQVEFAITVLVHGVIPLILFLYTSIYLFASTHAKHLAPKTFIIGLFYPTIYMAFYLMISVIWQDPYAVTNFYGKGWYEIWKIPSGYVTVVIGMLIMIYSHNYLLKTFNIYYRRTNGLSKPKKARIKKATKK